MADEMEDREWLNEYPVLKQVDNTTPFSVPGGYFTDLNERIISAVGLNGLKTKMPLSGFAIPENYFEELNSNIQSRVNIEQALSAGSGFTVPENYFEKLNDQVNSRIFIEEALSQNTGFSVPDNYFEELNTQITSRIFVEEALAEKPCFTVPENYFEELNNQISSRIFVEEALVETADDFVVPHGYFERLNQNILSKTADKPIAKPKSKVVRMFSSVAFKYATAACLVLMVGTGIVLRNAFSPNAIHNRSDLHKQLSGVPMEDIQTYLELNVDDTQHSVSTGGVNVNDADLDDALQSYPADTQ